MTQFWFGGYLWCWTALNSSGVLTVKQYCFEIQNLRIESTQLELYEAPSLTGPPYALHIRTTVKAQRWGASTLAALMQLIWGWEGASFKCPRHPQKQKKHSNYVMCFMTFQSHRHQHFNLTKHKCEKKKTNKLHCPSWSFSLLKYILSLQQKSK